MGLGERWRVEECWGVGVRWVRSLWVVGALGGRGVGGCVGF